MKKDKVIEDLRKSVAELGIYKWKEVINDLQAPRNDRGAVVKAQPLSKPS